MAQGKKPFFLKKSEMRKLELKAKYEELKAKGQLDRWEDVCVCVCEHVRCAYTLACWCTNVLVCFCVCM